MHEGTKLESPLHYASYSGVSEKSTDYIGVLF